MPYSRDRINIVRRDLSRPYLAIPCFRCALEKAVVDAGAGADSGAKAVVSLLPPLTSRVNRRTFRRIKEYLAVG